MACFFVQSPASCNLSELRQMMSASTRAFAHETWVLGGWPGTCCEACSWQEFCPTSQASVPASVLSRTVRVPRDKHPGQKGCASCRPSLQAFQVQSLTRGLYKCTFSHPEATDVIGKTHTGAGCWQASGPIKKPAHRAVPRAKQRQLRR